MVAGSEAQVSAAVQNGPKQAELATPSISPSSFVFAVIENTNIELLLDTGSEISLISESVRMCIPSPMQKS